MSSFASDIYLQMVLIFVGAVLAFFAVLDLTLAFFAWRCRKRWVKSVQEWWRLTG